MKTLLIATKNPGKIKEFEAMFKKYGIIIQSLLDVDQSIDVEETGVTFKENAKLKAEQVANHFQAVTIADDSGLIVDALDGKPGVYSARYAGEDKNDQANTEKVIEELQGVPYSERTARFCTVLAIAKPGKPTEYVEGYCEGFITESPQGSQGFGYDPIFYLPDYDKTMAQISREEKNKMSHRAQAMKQLEQYLPNLLEEV